MNKHPARSRQKWSANALEVLASRYFLKGADGQLLEGPAQLLSRVAKAIAEPEKPRLRRRWEGEFLQLMESGKFLPNSPTLMNAGREGGQLSACFVLPILDSLDSIFEALKQAARIHQSGGGTGFSFSRIRGRGSEVQSSHGAAGGPLAFLGIFDQATEAIKQGGVRRGANMGVLSVNHPDIFEFIDVKRDLQSITNFNLSVGVTSGFFSDVRADREMGLVCPHTGRELRRVRAREIFDRIVDSAWACGDPGLIFLDRTNLFNPTPAAGEFEATNPCGEQPLLPYESCNLGSIDLGKFVRAVGKQERGVDWDELGRTVVSATRFLDNVIDANHYPIAACERITRKNRKIGLGVMGFADLLLKLGIPYGSAESEMLAERVMAFVDRMAKRSSAQLARERGPFSGFEKSIWARLGYPALRNATVSTVAPTGTISLLLGASSGIEPIFSARIQRNVLGGKKLVEVHRAVEEALRGRGLSGQPSSEAEVASALGEVWRPAHALRVEEHLRIQAAFQRHSDSAVSKTINLPASATREDVGAAYFRAHELGCKGITVFRDKSRGTQVLEQACDLCVD